MANSDRDRVLQIRLHLTAWRLGHLIGQPRGDYRTLARRY